MTQQLIRALIETRLETYADGNGLDVEFENTTFTAPAGPYLRFNLLPAATRSDDLAGTFRTWSGIAQITICIPIGNGPAVADQYVIDLDAVFRCGLNIKSNPAVDLIDLTVVVATPLSEPAGFVDNAHWCVPAYFQYRCDFVTDSGPIDQPPPPTPGTVLTADSTQITADSTAFTADQQ